MDWFEARFVGEHLEPTDRWEYDRWDIPGEWLPMHYFEALNCLFRIENALRLLIYIGLKREFEENWANITLFTDDSRSLNLKTIARERAAKDEQFEYLAEPLSCPLMYLTGGELVGIILADSYWRLFKRYFTGSASGARGPRADGPLHPAQPVLDRQDALRTAAGSALYRSRMNKKQGGNLAALSLDAQLAVTISKDIAIESSPNDDVLKAPLKEMLNDEGLELDFHLKLGHLALELIRPDQCIDLREPRYDGLHLHVTAELLRLLLRVLTSRSLLRFARTATASVELRALGR
jgi:hypothetical protein